MLNEKDSDTLNRIAGYLKRSYILQRYQSLGETPILTIHHRDIPVQFFLPDATSDFIQGRILEEEQFFEHRLLMKIPPDFVRGKLCIDAGANIGNHSLFFTKILGARKVIAFEPQRHVFDILSQNIAINELSNVEARNAAVGASNTPVTVATGTSKNLGAVTFREDPKGDFPVVTLDSLKLVDVGLIKIDVEGMQMQVLHGAQETLKHNTQAVMIELRPELNEVEEPTRFLEAMGYTAKPLGRTDFLFTKS